MICLTELLLYAKSLLVILLFYQKVIDTCNCQNDLNSELESISNWAYQWKLQFNPDHKKQANETIFFP